MPYARQLREMKERKIDALRYQVVLYTYSTYVHAYITILTGLITSSSMYLTHTVSSIHSICEIRLCALHSHVYMRHMLLAVLWQLTSIHLVPSAALWYSVSCVYIMVKLASE